MSERDCCTISTEGNPSTLLKTGLMKLTVPRVRQAANVPNVRGNGALFE